MNEEVKETAGDKAIRLNRIKNANEAYQELKVLHTDPLSGEIGEDFPKWSIFRDDFIADWTNNRVVVTEKEADAMFDEIVNEAEKELATVETPVVVPTVETAAIVAPAKRVRKAAVKKAVKVAKKKVVAKKVRKVVKKVAAKKAGKGKIDLARATFEKYSAKGWSRADILGRMVEVNGLSPAYAATAYQKLKSE